MGTGWRRAFCTSIPRDPENAAAPEKQQNHRRVRQQLSPSSSPSNQSQSPRSCAKFGVFSGGGSSNSSSLRLRCRTADTSSEHPLLSPALDSMSAHHCKNGDFSTPYTPPPPPPPSSAGVKGSPRLLLTRSNPASPRSPSRFALLKATLRLSRSRCGICSQSVRTGQRTAVFTAECSHSFHFPCISTHVRSQSRNQAGSLSCPVCSASWREVPLLSSAHSPATPLPPSSTNKDFISLSHSNKARIQRSAENDLKHSGNSKMYNDDEPLLLSSASQGGLHFNPIPEADLEDEAEVGISYGRSGVEVGGSGVDVVVLPEAAMVSADRNHQTYVILLRVKAPAFAQRSVSKVAASVLDPSRRAPIDLVTVLDVSGSMASAAKLQMLKRAMRLLISSLGSTDRLSIVAFSAGAKRLLPLVRMSRQGQRSARQIVDRLIVCGGGGGGGSGDNGVQGDCRCIGHALRKATKVLEDRRERNPVATIMLLSDSHQEQNRGEEGSSGSSPRLREEEADKEKHLRNPFPSSTESVATRFAHLEIPIGSSTELSGGGVNQVEDVFSKCVSGLVSLVLQDVHLHLNFPSAFVSSIYSYGTAGGGGGAEGCVGLALSQGQGGNGISVRLGDFYADEKRELLVELRLPAAAPQQQRNDLLSYKCCYRDPTSRELVLCDEKSIVLPSLRQISPTAVSSRELRNLFITTRALVESRRLADHNELETAAHLLSTARSLLIQSNSAPSHHQKYVTSLELRLSKLQRRHRRQHLPSSSSMARPSDQLTPTSAWRAAEQLAKVAILRKSMSRVGDLHGFENARF